MRKPRSIAVLALVGLGLFGAAGLNSAPHAHALSFQVAGQPPPDDGCPQVPGAPKDFCPPPPPPGGGCPTLSAPGCPPEDCDIVRCPPPPEDCDIVRCPPPPEECDIVRCPPPPECECETTTTTTVGKTYFPGVLWNPTYTG
ncbi:MAG TPA: hypothetical protein VM121_06670 [Acidimicrobiales bacterium]|nr:hypothetical protein [Acidimicrobiales bacterium]